MRVSQTIPPDGSMVTCLQQRCPPLAFTHRDFPRLPESFHNIMNCGWWNTLIICKLVLRNIVFEPTDNSLTKFGIKWWTTSYPCSKPLVEAPFILNLDNLTCYQLNCYLWNLPETVLLVTFSVLFCLCPNSFWVCCRHHILLFFIFTKYN